MKRPGWYIKRLSIAICRPNFYRKFFAVYLPLNISTPPRWEGPPSPFYPFGTLFSISALEPSVGKKATMHVALGKHLPSRLRHAVVSSHPRRTTVLWSHNHGSRIEFSLLVGTCLWPPLGVYHVQNVYQLQNRHIGTNKHLYYHSLR